LSGNGQTRTKTGRFHGRVGSGDRRCEQPGCEEPGEFRAPRAPGHGGESGERNGAGRWRWLCLDHVRAFNDSYNYFAGMDADEIAAEQRPFAGWERETRAFSVHAHAPGPRWADFADPLDAIGARFADLRPPPRADGRPLSDGDRRALKVLGLGPDADRRALRQRYADLLHRYHPDRNGGDRSHEKALQAVISAYTQLKTAPAFA